MSEKPFVPSDDDETTATDQDGDPGDADLLAAAQAALGERTLQDDKPKEEPDRDEHGRFIKQAVKPKEEKKEPEKAERPSSIIARELAKREAAREQDTAHKAKLAEATQLMARAQEMMATVQQQAALLAKERETLAAARRDPAAFMAQVGWTADQFIDNATRAKDPAYQQVVSLQEALQKSQELIGSLTKRIDGLEGKAKSYDEMGQKAQVQAEVQEFWTSIPKESPVWQDFEDQDDILYQARKVRQQYYNRTGQVASPKQLGEYLHYRALEKRNGASAETAGQKPIAGQTKAKVPRALGSKETSERRGGAAVKHVHDMTPDEEKAYLMDVAAAALAGGD